MMTSRPRGGVNLIALLCLVLIAAACSEEVPSDYTSAHREAFLTACSQPLDDPRLLSDICVCVYDELQSEIPFERFEALSETLATASIDADPAQAPEPLPDEVVTAIADCMISEADL